MVNEEDNTVAPLRNVLLLHGLVSRLINRRPNEDSFGVFYGPSGYGKSCAASYCRNKYRGVLIRAGSTWTGRYLVGQIAGRLKIRSPAATTPAIIQQIVSVLLDDPKRPIILDEADFLVKKSIIEIIRDITDGSKNPVILIGEEGLKGKLARWTRIEDRVIEWVEPVPCDLADTKQLARLYSPRIAIDDDLLQRICTQSEGRARRIERHLSRVNEIALERALTRVGLAHWDGAPPLPAEAA